MFFSCICHGGFFGSTIPQMESVMAINVILPYSTNVVPEWHPRISCLVWWNGKKETKNHHVLFWNFAATNTCINLNKNANFLFYNCTKTAILICTRKKHEWFLIYTFLLFFYSNSYAQYCIMHVILVYYLKLFSCYFRILTPNLTKSWLYGLNFFLSLLHTNISSGYEFWFRNLSILTFSRQQWLH